MLTTQLTLFNRYKYFTVRLFNSRCHGAQKIVRSHKDLMLIVMLRLQCGEVSKYLIRRGVLSHAVLILDDLFGSVHVQKQFSEMC